jgi:ribonuclease HII
MELFPPTELSTLHFEDRARQQGFRAVAGIDEAGRGPLAGPVVAAAVILPAQFELPGLTDSKKLSAKARERLYPLIRAQAVAVGIGVGRVAEIDQVNILQSTLRSMTRAVDRLSVVPDFLLIDGINQIPMTLPQKAIKKGDSRSLSIAAASVVAKVVRDRLMVAYDRLYPGYDLGKHKGYGSQAHRDAIATLGPSPCHRRTFGGVREFCELP